MESYIEDRVDQVDESAQYFVSYSKLFQFIQR